jgi:hypothetical protein
MLAYMDGLLEPEDSEDIRKKIEASKFATDMFHRIRDGMRRLRLAAPGPSERGGLSERGAGLDANTVAEYLDNALSGDQVPDFEKLCLESDMHLAEVASCHQILALVLGEPAEIDPASRERMYQVPLLAEKAADKADAERAAGAASGLEEEAGTADGPKYRPRPTVPEYLREPRKKRRLLPIAAMLLLLGGFVGILLLVLGPFGRNTPSVKWLAGVWGRFQAAAGPEEPAAPPAPPSGEPSPPEPKAKAEAAEASRGKTSPEPALEPGKAVANEGEKPKPAVEPPAAKAAPGAVEGGAGQPPAGKPAAPAAEKKAEPPAMPGPAEAPKPPLGPKTPPAPGIPPPPPEPEGVAGPARTGRFMSEALAVLLRYNADTSTWTRVAPEEFLLSGQPLLALPTYRPRIVILNVATAEMLSGTQVQLLAPDAQGRPGIDVDFGRVVIKPLAQPGIRIRLSGGGHAGILTLNGIESIAALEVIRVHPPGTDPQTQPSESVATLYVTQGGAVWEDEAKQRTVPLPAPAQWSFGATPAGPPEGAAARTPPTWIVTDTSSPLDRRASATVAQAFSMDRPASLVLMELTEDRRREIKALARRCLAYLGQFEPMVAALDDNDLRFQWPEYVDQLRQAVVRGSASATAVRQAMERRFGPAAGRAFYRMLWGYTDQQLAAGEDAELVKNLDHEILAVRVLAFWNLKEITTSGFFYRPEDPAQKRQQPIQRWKQLLAAGKIRIKTPQEKSRMADAAAPVTVEKPAAAETPAAAEGPKTEEKPAVAEPGDLNLAPEPAAKPPAEPPTATPPPRERLVVPEPPVEPDPDAPPSPAAP